MLKKAASIEGGGRLLSINNIRSAHEKKPQWIGETDNDNIVFIKYQNGTIHCGKGKSLGVAKQSLRPFVNYGDPTDRFMDTHEMINALKDHFIIT